MFQDDVPAKSLINLKKYAEMIGVTRQAVHYQLRRGICSVHPIIGTKPPKWDLADVIAYRRAVEIDDNAN